MTGATAAGATGARSPAAGRRCIAGRSPSLARLAGFGPHPGLPAHGRRRTRLGDIYQAANTVPNIVFEIVAGGALASLVVPLLAGAVAGGDRAGCAATASALLDLDAAAARAARACWWRCSPGRSSALLRAATPAPQVDAGGRMLRVFAPQLPLYGVGIVLTGVLQAHRRFAWPVLAPLLSSVTVIGAYLLFAAVDGARRDVGRAQPRPAS